VTAQVTWYCGCQRNESFSVNYDSVSTLSLSVWLTSHLLQTIVILHIPLLCVTSQTLRSAVPVCPQLSYMVTYICCDSFGHGSLFTVWAPTPQQCKGHLEKTLPQSSREWHETFEFHSYHKVGKANKLKCLAYNCRHSYINDLSMLWGGELLLLNECFQTPLQKPADVSSTSSSSTSLLGNVWFDCYETFAAVFPP